MGFNNDYFMGDVHSIYTNETLKKKDLAWWHQSSSAHSWVHNCAVKLPRKIGKLLEVACSVLHFVRGSSFNNP